MSIHKRLKELRADKNKSLQEVADGIGVSWQTVQQWEKEDGTAPKRTRLEAVAKYYGVSSNYLLGYDDFVETEKGTYFIESKSKSIHTLNDDEIIINQYHDVVGAMGKGLVLRGETGQITGWKVTKDWINNNVPLNTGNKNLVIVTGFGDSMKGMFNSGDPLIVDIGVKSLDYDGVYFFRIGDEGFIKTLQRIPLKGINVISENKKYESWTITEDMDFEVLGRVLKVWKSEEF